MRYLEEITADELRQVLADVDGKRATQRVIAGITYKEGIAQTTLAEWYGVSPSTIRNWLQRLERLATEPVAEVVYDAPRSGRPPKLTDEQREQLDRVLHLSPRALDIDAPTWEPAIVQRYIEATFGVEYGLRQVRNLMDDAGVSWTPDRSTALTADERATEAFKGGFREEPPR